MPRDIQKNMGKDCGQIEYGASPRASLWLALGSKAMQCKMAEDMLHPRMSKLSCMRFYGK